MQRLQSRVAQQRHKRRRAQGQASNAQGEGPQHLERCPGKGGAKTAARAYASDFYAGPNRRGPAEDHSIELRSKGLMQRPTYRAEDLYSSHHLSGAPRPGAPRRGQGFRIYGYALHTHGRV